MDGWNAVLAFFITGWIVLGAGIFTAYGVIQSRIYPDDNTQPLATVCQVEEFVKRKIDKLPKPQEAKKYDGWLLDDRGNKRQAIIIERTPDGKQVKVRYTGGYVDELMIRGEFLVENYRVEEKWLPIEDFHKNYTTEELSEMIRELQTKKKH